MKLGPTLKLLGLLLLGLLPAAAPAQPPKEEKTPPPATGDPKAPPPGSVLPEPTAPPAPTRPTAQLEVVALRVGRSEIKQFTGLGGSFITNSPTTLDVTGEARVKGRPELAEAIAWQLSAPEGFVPAPDAQLLGPRLSARFVRPAGNPTGAGGYLSLTVGAKVEVDGKPQRRSVLLTQDARDRLRQEYVDLARVEIPDRDALMDEGQFYRRFGRRYRSVGFDELNTSRSPATGRKYLAIPLTEALVRTLHLTEKAYGRAVQVNSGFRNPVRQLEVHAEVEQSHHQYGRAADLHVPPVTLLGGRRVAAEPDWLRLASAALQGGGAWIEPMLACHVNTDGCHVHVDVRPGPPQSRVVTVRGQVTDPSGNPVPGAVVRLAGMPAIVNAHGSYQLKQVVTAPAEEIAVEAPGRGRVTRAVSVAVNLVTANLSVPADPNPTLLARLEPATRTTSGVATLRLVLKNTGLSEARSVKLAAGMTGTTLTLGELLPAELASIPPGAEGSFNVQVTAAPGTVALARTIAPLKITANYFTPAGEQRDQIWTLDAQVDPAPVAEPPGAAAAATATPSGRAAGAIQSPGRGGLDFGAALAGLLLGALAGGVAVALRPRAAEPPPASLPEPPGPPRTAGPPPADPEFVEPPALAAPEEDAGEAPPLLPPPGPPSSLAGPPAIG